jgi:hypothetical protein
LSIIDVEIVPKIRKGEAGTIVLNLPQTEGLKVLKIEVPAGVVSPSGSSINLAPDVTRVDIPILITKDAPESVTVKFHLMEKYPAKRKSVEGTTEYLLKIAK